MAVDDTPTDDDNDSSPLAQPEGKIAFAAGIVFVANLLCLILLAARAESSPELHGYFDVGICAVVLGVVTYALARFMFLFPFGLLDLFVIVFTLALGMNGAIMLAHWIRDEYPLISGWSLYAVVCMVVGCVLMCGAAIGLRNCRILEIQSALKRALVVVCGMLTLPGIFCLVLTPFHLIHALLTASQTPADTLTWVGAMILSAISTGANSMLSLRAMRLETINASQHSTWPK